jgi:hypothetical protein
VGIRVSLDTVEKRKKIPSLPLLGIEPWSSSPYPSHYTHWDTPALDHVIPSNIKYTLVAKNL